MNLYLISRTDSVGWDEFDAHVIRAESEEYARNIAARSPGDEGAGVWTSPEASTCELIGTGDGEPGIVLASFRAG